MSKIVKIQAPDGSIIKVEGPDNATDEQFIQEGIRLYGQQAKPQAAAPPQPPQRLHDTTLGGMALGVDPFTFGERIKGAGASLVNALFPAGDVKNPNLQLPEMTPQQQVGEKAVTLGSVAPAVDPLVRALGRYGKSAAGNAAERLYESALKPGPRSNTRPEVQRMVQTGLREGIPVSQRGTTKLDQLVDALNTEIQGKVDAAESVMISPSAVATRVDPLAARLKFQDRTKDLSEALSNQGSFLRRHRTTPEQPTTWNPTGVPARDVPIPAVRAQAMKQGIWQELKDSAFGELQHGYKESQKQLGRGLREELAEAIADLNPLNRREGNLLGLRDELEAAVNRNRNKEMFGIGSPILGAGTAAATGSPALGAVAGLGRALIDRPGFKSRLAIALARLSR